VIDEIQREPRLYEALRPLVDREARPVRFLILGSASPDLIRGIYESLALPVESALSILRASI
jgi:predicted AAA+ superfamily ATPase